MPYINFLSILLFFKFFYLEIFKIVLKLIIVLLIYQMKYINIEYLN